MSNPCKPKSLDLGIRAGRVNDAIQFWFKDSRAISKMFPKTSQFKTFYRNATGKDFEFGSTPELKDIKLLQRKMKKMDSKLLKNPTLLGSTWLAEQFFLPEEILKRNPIGKEAFDGLTIAGNYYRGSMEKHTANLNKMVKLLNEQALMTSVKDAFGLTSTAKATKEIARMENEYKTIFQEQGSEAAWKYYDKNLRDLGRNNHDLATIQSLYEVITNPKKIFANAKTEAEAKAKYGTNVVMAAKEWRDMSKDLWDDFQSGLKNYIEMLEGNRTLFGEDRPVVDKLKEKLSDIKYEDNYLPTQILDVIPTLNRLTEDIYTGKYHSNEKSTNVKEYVNNMLKDLENNLSVPGHAFERRADSPYKVSKNVLNIIDSYQKSITRFNYTARSSNVFSKALREVAKLDGKEFDSQTEFLANYLRETHSASLGLHMKGSKLREFARTATAWQFVSKLGGNLRTAGKNATQSLQNFVYFGYKASRDAIKFASEGNMSEVLDKEMKKHGVFFVGLQDLAVTSEMLPKTSIVDGKVVETSQGAIGKFNNVLNRVAEVTGKPMQWVENKVNRQLTFKIAFSKMYQDLSKNDDLIRKYISKKGFKDSKDIATAMEKEIIKRSSRYAAEMTKTLHYEYSPWAKPKALRSAVGSVAFQFMNYGINFFNYQKNIAVDAWDAAAVGKYFSPETWRLVKLGLMYEAIVPTLSSMMSTDLSGTIQNDTKEKLRQVQLGVRALGAKKGLKDWQVSQEEWDEVFYGRDPRASIFGPSVADALRVGQMTSLKELLTSEEDTRDYIRSYQDFVEETGDMDAKQFLGFINVEAGRIFGHVKSIINGTTPGNLIQSEFGWWRDEGAIKNREESLETIREYAPNAWKTFLTPNIQIERDKIDLTRAVKGQAPLKSSIRRNYTTENLKRIQESLDLLDQDML